MANPDEKGQPPGGHAPIALARLAQAARALLGTRRLEIEAHLDAYRTLEPTAHPGARAEALDLGFLGACLALGGTDLLRARHLIVARGHERAPPTVALVSSDEGGAVVELRAPPAPHAAADGLALLCGIAAESEKLEALGADTDSLPLLARRLGVDEEAIVDALGVGREQASEALSALVEVGARRTLHLAGGADAPELAPTVDVAVLKDASQGAGPIFILSGATDRFVDVVSPYVRRLRAPLERLAGGFAEDALYDALAVLFAAEPACALERAEVEREQGLIPAGGATVIRFDELDPSRADTRARGSCRTLRAARALAVVTGPHPSSLAAVLDEFGERARAVVLLSEGLAPPGRPVFPDIVVDAETGHPLELRNGLGAHDDDAPSQVSLTVPSLGLAPRAAPVAEPLLFSLAATTIRARALGRLPRSARLAAALTAQGDGPTASDVVLACLERMAAARPGGTRPPFRARR